jgi:hypothetical protein
MGDVKITIEAKIHWPETDKKSEIMGIKERLDAARSQLKTLAIDYQYGDPYSVCYIVPWPHKEDYESASREGSTLLNRLADKFANDDCLIANYLADSPPEYEGRVYPGVLLVARREEWPG